MHRATRSLLLALMLVAAGAHAAETPVQPSYLESLPAAHPHREILQKLVNLPADEGAALDKWLTKPEGESPPGTAELIAAVTEHLRATAGASTTENLWPFESANATEAPILKFQAVRRFTRLGKTAAMAASPAESVNLLQSMAAFGRSLRNSEGPLVHGMMGMVAEETARSGLAARLGELDLASLDRLEALERAIPPAISDERFFRGELAWMESHMTRYVLPGLLELSRMSEQDLLGGSELARRFRLSGVLEMGDGEKWIMLETARDGQSLRLKEGESAEGVTVVSIDIPNRRAVLRHAQGEAVVDLESKTIREQSAKLDALDNYLRSGADDDTPEKRRKFITELWRRLHARPEAVTDYMTEQLEQLELAAKDAITAAKTAAIDDMKPWPGIPDASPFVNVPASIFPSLARNIHEYDTRARMLAAAIALRRTQLGGPAPDAAALADPWAKNVGDAYVIETAVDGSFVLRSNFEQKNKKPLSYKFAAVDAGIIK